MKRILLFVLVAMPCVLCTPRLQSQSPPPLQWQPANIPYNGSVYSFLALPSGTLFAGMKDGGISRSINNGASWMAVGVNLVYARTVSSFAANGTTLFAGTDNGVFRSTDNGTTWIAANEGLTNHYVWSLAISGTTLFAGTWNSNMNIDDGLFRSLDNGGTWSRVGLRGITPYTFAIINTTLFAGTSIGIFRSTDNGTNWTVVSAGLSVNDFALSGTTLFAGTEGGVYRSTDSGISWTATNTGFIKPKGFNNYFVRTLAVSGTTIFAGTWGSGVFRSTDNGANWTSVNTGLGNGQMEIHFLTLSGTMLFAGTYYQGVFRASLIPTAVRTESEPLFHALQYPNPFAERSTIEYELSAPEYVRVDILSALGQVLVTLVQERQNAGHYSLPVDMSAYPSGVYFFRLHVGDHMETKLMQVTR